MTQEQQQELLHLQAQQEAEEEAQAMQELTLEEMLSH